MKKYLLLCLLVAGCGVQPTAVQKVVLKNIYGNVCDANDLCQSDPLECYKAIKDVNDFLEYLRGVKMDRRQTVNLNLDQNMVIGELNDPNSPADHKQFQMRAFTELCQTWVERSE